MALNLSRDANRRLLPLLSDVVATAWVMFRKYVNVGAPAVETLHKALADVARKERLKWEWLTARTLGELITDELERQVCLASSHVGTAGALTDAAGFERDAVASKLLDCIAC